MQLTQCNAQSNNIKVIRIGNKSIFNQFVAMQISEVSYLKINYLRLSTLYSLIEPTSNMIIIIIIIIIINTYYYLYFYYYDHYYYHNKKLTFVDQSSFGQEGFIIKVIENLQGSNN